MRRMKSLLGSRKGLRTSRSLKESNFNSSSNISIPIREPSEYIPAAGLALESISELPGDDVRKPLRTVEGDLSQIARKKKEERTQVINELEGDDIFIAIGVDFGTTYSGVAWSLSTSPNDVFIVSNWETDLAHNHDMEKVPSVLTYNSQGKVTSWGFSPEETREWITWFKLRLSDEASRLLAVEQPERYRRLEGRLMELGKSPVEVVANYLENLWHHAIESMKAKLDPCLWDDLKFKIVLTVPAIWDNRAQAKTRRAAEMAGMLAHPGTTLELIGEPEAAALAVCNEMTSQSTPDSTLKVGDCFVVCDAGGGTVDLISYRIERLNPLMLEMCAEATGGFCGGVFLDLAFENQIRTIVSQEDYASLSVRSRRKMMNDWEHGIKRTFKMDAAEDIKWHVDIPGYLGAYVEPSDPIRRPQSTLSMRMDPGTVVLQTGHLRAIFGQVSSRIKDLISDQVIVVKAKCGKLPSTILLVGGLGENKYLKQDIDRSFDGVLTREIKRPWSAVCRGAVLKALGHDIVLNHVSKFNYGCCVDELFIEGRHDESDRRFNDLQGIWQAASQMNWFLERGKNIMKASPVQQRYYIAVRNREHLSRIKETIYYSSSLEPEIRITPAVERLCKVEMEFSPTVFDELPVQHTEKGVEWRKLSYVMEMQISSGQLCWSAKYKGVEVGKVETRVEYDGVP